MCHVSCVTCHVSRVTCHVSHVTCQNIFFTFFLLKKNVKLNIWTCDTWHVTHDTWHMTHSVGWTFSQNFSSLALLVWDWECLEDILTKGWLNQLLSDGYTGSVNNNRFENLFMAVSVQDFLYRSQGFHFWPCWRQEKQGFGPVLS